MNYAKFTIVISFIVVTAFAADPTPQSTPKPIGEPPATRSLIIKAAIDAGDDFIIQDGKIFIQHIDYSPPTKISINGRKWEPVWTDHRSDDFTNFNHPLGSLVGTHISLRLKKGRGEVSILEQPSESNGYKAIIHFQDMGAGADNYEIRISW